jgi:hypothetical protein
MSPDETSALPQAPQDKPAATRDKPKRPRRKTNWLVASLIILASAFGGWYCVQRYWFSNFDTVVEGRMYRSGSPRKGELAGWIALHGIKTVVNLSDGPGTSAYAAEREIVWKTSGRSVSHKLKAGELPTREELCRLIQIIESEQQPILVHCEVGAQRTGLASVIGAMALGGQDYHTARKQLSIRYLLFYVTSTGAEGVVLRYEDYCRQKGLDTGGWKQFREWAATVYQP